MIVAIQILATVSILEFGLIIHLLHRKDLR